MAKNSGGGRGNTLRRYEGVNLLFFLAFLLALGAFVAFVFNSYKDAGKRPPRTLADGKGIVSEAVYSTAESCLFYLGTKISDSSLRYDNPLKIPAGDDGLVRDLFAIPGVVGVQVDQMVVVLQKSPSAHWEAIQPGARAIISNHLHMHK